jgi:hypothetical protein
MAVQRDPGGFRIEEFPAPVNNLNVLHRFGVIPKGASHDKHFVQEKAPTPDGSVAVLPPQRDNACLDIIFNFFVELLFETFGR